MFEKEAKAFRLLIAAACLIQEDDEREAATRFLETPADQELTPFFAMETPAFGREIHVAVNIYLFQVTGKKKGESFFSCTVMESKSKEKTQRITVVPVVGWI